MGLEVKFSSQRFHFLLLSLCRKSSSLFPIDLNPFLSILIRRLQYLMSNFSNSARESALDKTI